MVTLKLNSVGEDVIKLQKLLNSWDYCIDVTGIFDIQTYEAVKSFQSSNNLGVDGIVGIRTWTKLEDVNSRQLVQVKITEDDYRRAANTLNVEVAAIKAVKDVETGGRGGFFALDKPAILFEGHIFWKQLRNQGIDPHAFVKGNEDILYEKWTKKYYKGGLEEYKRLERARAIHSSAADSSASWGLFQIMGFNYKVCGCNSIAEFVEKMSKDEGSQLDLFVGLLRQNGWDKYLRTLDWKGFAMHYNGPAYAQNKYDEKLYRAYMKYKV